MQNGGVVLPHTVLLNNLKRHQLRLLKFRQSFMISRNSLDKVDTLNSRVEELAGSLDKAQLERDTLATKVCELEATKVTTKQHNLKYRDSVRQCCME